MKTYQTWSTTIPMEYIEAPNSFTARKQFADKHNVKIAECMAMVKPADLHVQFEGSIYILFGMTDAGKAWMAEHLPEDAPRWTREGVVIGQHCIVDIVAGAIEAGLEVL